MLLLQYPIWWHAPIWSGSGYGSEALNYVFSLVRLRMLSARDVWVAQHGDVKREKVRRWPAGSRVREGVTAQ